MRKEIAFVLYVMGLGASLVAYAHVSFATKSTVDKMAERIKTIDQRVYDIHSKLLK